MSDLFASGPDAPFIAVKRIDRDGSRRVVTAGRLKREPAGDGAYPEDWQEQRWCCRECAVLAWNSMSLELRREFAAEVAARRGAS